MAAMAVHTVGPLLGFNEVHPLATLNARPKPTIIIPYSSTPSWKLGPGVRPRKRGTCLPCFGDKNEKSSLTPFARKAVFTNKLRIFMNTQTHAFQLTFHRAITALYHLRYFSNDRCPWERWIWVVCTNTSLICVESGFRLVFFLFHTK